MADDEQYIFLYLHVDTSSIPVTNQATVRFKKKYLYIFCFICIQTKEGYVHFLIILILIYESLLLLAHSMFLRNHSSNEMNKMPNVSVSCFSEKWSLVSRSTVAHVSH